MNQSIHCFITSLFFILPLALFAQTLSITGKVTNGEKQVSSATIRIKETRQTAIANEDGSFLITSIQPGSYWLYVSSVGYEEYRQFVTVRNKEALQLTIHLAPDKTILNDVVVTGVSKAT